VENCLPLHPCSQHCGFGREFRIRGITALFWAPGEGESDGPSLGGAWGMLEEDP
jgi:hypothetical protein